MRPIIVIAGTRAEALKLVPLHLALLKQRIPSLLCATFQHFELSEQVFQIFKVKPDFNLNIMKENQDLFHITNSVLAKTKDIFLKTNPCLVIVQGDTTTTMAAALSAFYLHIPIAHVEAGLRTGNMHAPFPEEMNRKVVGQIATYHFSPTAFSTANLLSEGVDRTHVFCTGNTIVDSLHDITKKIDAGLIPIDNDIKQKIQACKHKKIVLLTAHRRESFNGGLTRVFRSIKTFLHAHQDVQVFFPVHPNPNVKKAIEEADLCNAPNIHLFPSLMYKDLVYILKHADWVASDSGGIQEEAVSLGKKIIVLRDVTERVEGVWEGVELLVGTDETRILQAMEQLYHETHTEKPSSIYGDGCACKRIVSIITEKIYETHNNRWPRVYRPSNRPTRRKTQ